jgi:enterochelin esterase-like enzyme
VQNEVVEVEERVARRHRAAARRRKLRRRRAVVAGLLLVAGAAVGATLATGDDGRPAGHDGWRHVLPAGSIQIVAGPDGGSVWRVWIRNSFVPTRRPNYVYLPPYQAHVRYPVAYLLHGFPGSPATFIRVSRLAHVADDLIAARKLRPLIVVMPVAGRTDRYEGEWAGPWEKFVVYDVLPWTDAHLPTVPTASGRAIGGLSSGGYGAVDIAFRHSKLFGTVESWASYFHPLRDGPFAHATRSELAASDPTLLVSRLAPALRREHVRVFLAAGAQDPVDITRARDFANELGRQGIEHVVVLRPGAHHNSFWRRILVPGLAYTFPARG